MCHSTTAELFYLSENHHWHSYKTVASCVRNVLLRKQPISTDFKLFFCLDGMKVSTFTLYAVSSFYCKNDITIVVYCMSVFNGSTVLFHWLDRKDMRLWKSQYSPFMRGAQPQYCSQIIIVPLNVFHTMAETIGNPKAEIIYIFNVARCGSTLLTQVGTRQNAII